MNEPFGAGSATNVAITSPRRRSTGSTVVHSELERTMKTPAHATIATIDPRRGRAEDRSDDRRELVRHDPIDDTIDDTINDPATRATRATTRLATNWPSLDTTTSPDQTPNNAATTSTTTHRFVDGLPRSTGSIPYRGTP